ncbi:XVIPCD domain-containing protein [Lysobacter brunescens]|uniref:XVIPCD domain-containing protein n=1 Tax=Lysobacter brunescens TaxID=262323 RepID=A0ABW2YIM6_9GAMM
MADPRQQAAAVARAYDQGDIASLDDATTRRLVASTVLTAGVGGDAGAIGRFGHVGRYQVGAVWLAEAGCIDGERMRAAMTADGAPGEKAWARAGGMRAFLQESSNWSAGLDLQTFRDAPALQDRAFRAQSERFHQRAVDERVLGNEDSPLRVAGFLKACHFSGFGQARAAATGGRVHRDGNGPSNYDLMHDITRNRDGLNAVLAIAPETRTVAPSARDAAHPDHALFRQALGHLDKAGAYPDMAVRERAAVAMAAHARASGLDEIAYLGRSTAPDGRVFLVAVQGDPANPASKSAYLPETHAVDPARAPVAAPTVPVAADTQDPTQTRQDPARPPSPGR